jgi:hypothetical protein
MNTESFIFGTGTSRSGSSLVSNLLSTNKKVIMTNDLIHFFRYIYNRYNPIDNTSKQLLLIKELCLRLKYRNRISLSYQKIFNHFKSINSYSGVLSSLNSFLLEENPGKEIIGESANTEWVNIENLLEMNNNYKAYQVIRDPRAVLSSFKKLTSARNYDYLDIIFFWVDAVNHKIKYEKKYSADRYLSIKFENIHKFPEENAKKLCNFVNIDYDPNMINTENWSKLLNSKYIHINTSAHSNKKVFGFSKKRISNWNNNLEEWEVALIQYLLKDYLKMLDYELIDCSEKTARKGLEIIENNKKLNNLLIKFKKDKSGTSVRSDDPTKPENWGATDLSTNPNLKFIDTDDYKNYMKELNLIRST